MKYLQLNSAINKITIALTVVALCANALLLCACSKKNVSSNTATANQNENKNSDSNDTSEYPFYGSPENLTPTNDGSNEYYSVMEVTHGIDGHENPDSNLYRISRDLKQIEKIREDVLWFKPSPSGKRLMLFIKPQTMEAREENRHSLEVIDAKSRKIVFSMSNTELKSNPKTTYISGRGWVTGDNTIWYEISSDKKRNIYRHSLKTNKTERIVDGRGIAWSNDGRYLFYQENYRQTSEQDKNIRLAVYDYKLNKSKVVATEPKDQVGSALFSLDGKTVFYTLRYCNNTGDGKWRSYGQIKSVSVEGNKKDVVFEKSGDGKLPHNYQGNIGISGLEISADGKSLIFYILYYADVIVNKISGLYRVDISTKKESKFVESLGGDWDYNPKTDTFIWYQYSRNKGIKKFEKKLDEMETR